MHFTSKQLLAVILLNGRAACFTKAQQSPWSQEPLFGEAWFPLDAEHGLLKLVQEISSRTNNSNQLAGVSAHLIYDELSLPWMADVAKSFAAVHCKNWQVLEWLPLFERATVRGKKAPANKSPDVQWLKKSLLPVLEATFSYQEQAHVAERIRAEQEHVETLESLRADRLRLECAIEAQREQLASLQLPEMEELISYLPALYRNVFGAISPHDLALLAGTLEVPSISSPWPEPDPNTLQALQARLHKLPEPRAAQLRDFCNRLPHKLDMRAEMRTWLGDHQ